MIPKHDAGRDAEADRSAIALDAHYADTSRVDTPDSSTSTDTAAISPALPRRLVLDTNVCLDLFVFRDPRWSALLSALQQSRVQAHTRADCRMEWTLVLGYGRFGLDAAQQAAALAEFDRLIAPVAEVPASDAGTLARLPVCRDTDDQKFIELAAAIDADALITKDKLLLKLARKTRKQSLFRILSPEQWTAEWTAAMIDPRR